jgi:hypothetical protein
VIDISSASVIDCNDPLPNATGHHFLWNIAPYFVVVTNSLLTDNGRLSFHCRCMFNQLLRFVRLSRKSTVVNSSAPYYSDRRTGVFNARGVDSRTGGRPSDMANSTAETVVNQGHLAPSVASDQHL